MRSIKTLNLYLERSFQRDAVDFYLVGHERDDTVYIGKPVLIETRPEGDFGIHAEPTFSLTTDEAQSFVNELWKAGFRPSEEMSLGAFAAQSRHLEDMRKIAFTLFGKISEAQHVE